MEQVKDYCVVTFHETNVKDDQWTEQMHVYGPYIKKEAMRMADRLRGPHTVTYARKLLGKNEVTANPSSPRG